MPKRFMVIEDVESFKRFSANVAHVLFARMVKSFMLSEARLDREAGIADIAEEVLLACVQLHVVAVVVVCGKMSIAHLAVQLLPLLMDEHVRVEVPLRQAAFAANFTRERFILRVHE